MAAPTGYKDVIVEPRYDTVLYPAAGANLLTFFANPRGQGNTSFQTVGGAAIPKTSADTNMDLSGQLPGGYWFNLQGFRLMPSWDISDQDLHHIFNGCVFTFIIASKPFLTVPARTIPQGNGPSGSGANMNSNGFPALSNSYSIRFKPMEMEPTVNFQVTLTWPNGQALPATTATALVGGHLAGLPLTVFLDGFLYRPVQ
jgi:hypothetical protein